MRCVLGFSLLIGCDQGTTPEPTRPCDAEGVEVDVAMPSGGFGELGEGSDLWFGTPPQGGAPFSPLRLRIHGPVDFAEGAEIHIQTVDATTDELLGEAELPMGLACANVGENDGFWVGSEIHVRYSGFELAELEGREAKLMADVEAMAGDWHTLAVWSVRLRMDEVP